MVTNEERQAFWDRTVPEDAVEKANEIMRKRALIEGDDPEKEIALAEEFLRAGGVNLDSLTEITIIMERIQDELKGYWEKEIMLGKEAEEILLRSGVTKLQLKWGNISNARFSFWDRRKIRKLKRTWDENFAQNIPHLTMMAALCKNKERLEEA